MIGPPLRKLSIRKFPVNGGPVGAAGEAEAAGEALPLNVALTDAPGAGEPPGTPAAGLIAGEPAAPAGMGMPGGGGTLVDGAPGAAGAPVAGAPAAPVAGAPLEGAPGMLLGGGGFVIAGFCAAGAVFGGGGGAAGLFCANAVSAMVVRQSVSSVFIIAAEVE